MSSPKELNNKVKANSFDDLEIEKAKKKSINNSGESLGSQDDLNVKPPKLSEEEFVAKYTQDQEVKPKSIIRRFFSYVGNKVKTGLDSKVGKVIVKIGKVLTSNTLTRSIIIVVAALTITGVFPPAAPVVLGMAGVSLAAVAIGAGIDAYKTRKLRKLATENDLLVRNRGDVDKQKQLFIIDPRLGKILEKQLYIPNNEITSDKFKIDYKATVIGNIKKVLADSAPDIADLVAATASLGSGNLLSIAKVVKAGACVALGLGAGVYSTKQRADIVSMLKININEELKGQKIDNYSNLQELAEIVKKQEIQTMAIAELMRDENYFDLTDQQKSDKFEEYKANITKLKKDDKVKNTGYLEDLVKAHNPFYNQPNKVQEYTELTKAMKKNAEKAIVINPSISKSTSLPNIQKDNPKKNPESQKGKKRQSIISL